MDIQCERIRLFEALDGWPNLLRSEVEGEQGCRVVLEKPLFFSLQQCCLVLMCLFAVACAQMTSLPRMLSNSPVICAQIVRRSEREAKANRF